MLIAALALVACASGASSGELLDREWKLVSPATPSGVATPTLRFESDGRVSGNTGCNMTSGSYTTTGDELSIGPLVTTRRACAEERGNELERTYVGAIESARRFRIVNGELELLDGGGTVVARFRG